MSSPQLPVFVGGTQRSGSTVTGYLLGAHGEIRAALPREMRILTDDGALLDYAFGRRPAPGVAGLRARLWRTDRPACADVVTRLRGEWWQRTGPDGDARGFVRGVTPEHYAAAVDAFAARCRRRRADAGAELVRTLLAPQTQKAGASAWVDTTPQNAENAPRLLQMFPDAKIIHILRDGRDTAASVLAKPWGPDDPLRALDWWHRRILRAHRAMQQLPPGAGLTIALEHLTRSDRERTLQQLFAHVGLAPDASTRAYFDERVTPDRGHLQRWRTSIPEELHVAFDGKYQRMWHELVAQGVPLPALER